LLLIVSIGCMVGPMDAAMISVAMPSMTMELGLTFAACTLIPAAYLIVEGALLISVGRLSDQAGKKRLFVAGFAVFAIGSLLSGLAPNGEALIAARALQGVGAACIYSIGFALIANSFPEEGRGRALGLCYLFIYLGLAIGPLLGGILTQLAGWRSVFLFFAPVSAAIMALAILVLRDDRRPLAAGTHFDLAGAVLFGAALLAGLMAVTFGESWGWTSVPIILLACAFAALFAAFLARERKAANAAMLDLSLFRGNAPYLTGLMASLLVSISYFWTSLILSFYLENVKGHDPIYTGALLISMPLMMAVFSPLSGRYCDRHGTRGLAAAGLLFLAVGMLVMAQLYPGGEEVFFFSGLVLIGTGVGLFTSASSAQVMRATERSKQGVASGTLTTMRTCGMAMSIAMSGSVIAVVAGPAIMQAMAAGTPLTPDQVPSFIAGLASICYVAAALSAVAAALSLVALRPGGIKAQ
jgi:EmrB/QacA subfamily drug resistance transporter